MKGITMKETMETAIEAAGAVLFRSGFAGEPEICLVHRPRYDDWSFPKGKLKANESRSHAAVREVEEETGIPIRLLAFLGKTSYKVPAAIPDTKHLKKTDTNHHPKNHMHQAIQKIDFYWAAEQLSRKESMQRAQAFSSPILPTPDEADEVVWLPLSEAYDRLTYKSDRAILDIFSETFVPQSSPTRSATRPGP